MAVAANSIASGSRPGHVGLTPIATGFCVAAKFRDVPERTNAAPHGGASSVHQLDAVLFRGPQV
jgi:hypothetical protein